MSLLTIPRTAKWPFLLGDAMLLALAWFFYTQARLPMNGPTLAACVGCVAFGALLGITPFLVDHRAEVRLVESTGLATAVEQIRGLEAVAGAVESATSRWQGVHEHATEAVDAARAVSEKMSGEMQSFIGFLEKANDSERQHLRLEVDKLKRAESDWLGVLVLMLDHVFAIHSAARRAGQHKVVDQLAQLQMACRDAARRVGLHPFEAEAGTPFDPKQHQLPVGGGAPGEARVAETMATGLTFRGQLIRPALVAVEDESKAAPPANPVGDEASA